MSVQFIIGRAGTGKSQWIADQICAMTEADPLGPPIYHLLPRQATFQSERLFTARLKGFSRIRVVSFDLLGKEILERCGDIGIPEVTAVGRRMVIGHLLRRHQKQLKFYGGSAHRAGLASELDATFGEFERAGLDAPALDALVDGLHTDDTTGLHDKLSDIRLLLNEYNRFIGQDRLDPQRRLAMILKRVSHCDWLADSTFFVEDFYDFTAYERQLLCVMAAKAKQTHIALLMCPDSPVFKNPQGLPEELSTFHRTERTYQSLRRRLTELNVEIAPPLLLRNSHRTTSAELLLLEKQFLTTETGGPTWNATPLDIQCVAAVDARGEIEAVARKITELLTAGYRYRDIAVLTRDLDRCQPIIDAIFHDHSLPYFADHRRTAAHHPLLRLARAALGAVLSHFGHEQMMALVKSGLSGLSDLEIDELENYVLKHRISGPMWESAEPWEFARQLTIAEGDEPLALSATARIDQSRRRVVDALQPLLQLAGERTPIAATQWAIALFKTLEAFGARQALGAWMKKALAAEHLEERAEHEQVWTTLADLFDHLNDLLGSEQIRLADFVAIVETGMEGFDLALTPPTVDQIVVGQVDRTRTPEVKAVFVLGMNEGGFPAVSSERKVITDIERGTLQKLHIDLDPDSQRRLLDERFLAYLAFTRPSQKLVLSRTLANDKGRAIGPSQFWIDLHRLFPLLVDERPERSSLSDAAGISTPGQLVTSLLRWARLGAAADPLRESLYHWFTQATGRFQELRQQAWPALSYTNTALLQPDIAGWLFASPLQATVRELESMAACPFQHFARYGLQLGGRDRADITRIDLSNAYHEVLENLIQDMLSSRCDWCDKSVEELQQLIATGTAEIGRQLRGEVLLSSTRNQYLLNYIQRTLELAVAAMTEAHRRGNFRPAHVGLGFGPGQKMPPLVIETPAGNELHLRGKIDRVDINRDQSQFIVADYRMTTGRLNLGDAYHGLSLQLLAYLLVVQRAGPRLVGHEINPAAAFLLQLLRSHSTVTHPADAPDPDHPNFHLRVKPSGIIHQDAMADLDNDLVPGSTSAVINVQLKKDGEVGRAGTSDVVTAGQMDALLALVQQRLAEATDEVIAGNIAVAPYRMGDRSPCTHCDFRSVCRFEPGVNHYRILPTIGRQNVLELAEQQHGDGEDYFEDESEPMDDDD